MTAPAQPTPTKATPVVILHNDAICRMVVETLIQEGYTATRIDFDAHDMPQLIASALHTLEHGGRPSLVLVDPIFLGMPGTEDFRDYLQDVARRKPHLVYIVRASPDSLQQFDWLHADGLLRQPFTIDQLIDLVADAECTLYGDNEDDEDEDPFTIDI